MGRPDISPTKTNLRRVSADLEFALEGYELLEQKRELLVMEILRRMKEAREAEQSFQKLLREYYEQYRNAAMTGGPESVPAASMYKYWKSELHTEEVRAVGLTLTLMGVRTVRRHDEYQPVTDSGAVASMIRNVPELTSVMVQYAAVTSSVFILSRELKKVQRRVNALEKVFIPQCREAKNYISDRLEEMEREELYVKKLIGMRSEGETI